MIFFYTRASTRKRKNKISWLQDEGGTWLEGREKVLGHAQMYFQDLFSTNNPLVLEEAISSVEGEVSDEFKQFLAMTFTSLEVKDAIFQINATKSSSLDGMSPYFFEKYWSFLGSDVTRAIPNFLNNGDFIDGINEIFVVLISKIPNAQNMKHFRPISLCNVLYKIISKVVANRLNIVVPSIIS